MKTTNRKPRRLVCLQCEHEEFKPADSQITQEFRGQTLQVPATVMRCAHCGWETLGPGQVDALRVATADAYRKANGLLTSTEIRMIREAAGLSQRAFASELGVGSASIPRWESWQVQERAYDEQLRSFALRSASRSLSTLHWVITGVRMPTAPTPDWQIGVWDAMARGLRTTSQEPQFPGADHWGNVETDCIIATSARFQLHHSEEDGDIKSINDDALCSYA